MLPLLRHARYVLSENPVTGLAFGLFALFLVAAVLGPAARALRSAASNAAQALKPPSAAHWFGTDQLGRDIFSRVLVATRLDLAIAFASVVLAFMLGALSGVAAGYFGGWTDRIVGRARRHDHGLPAVRAGHGHRRGARQQGDQHRLATAIINLPLYARLARAEANVRREAGFVEAARLVGNGEARVLLGHILPNIMPLMMVQVSLTMGYAILNAAGLSFIGLGVRPPTPEWGIMVAEGANFIVRANGGSRCSPALALMLAVFCFNLLGDGLRDIIDPRRRT